MTITGADDDVIHPFAIISVKEREAESEDHKFACLSRLKLRLPLELGVRFNSLYLPLQPLA